MAERFTEHLREKVTGIWEAQHQHPFVRGIGDGVGKQRSPHCGRRKVERDLVVAGARRHSGCIRIPPRD